VQTDFVADNLENIAGITIDKVCDVLKANFPKANLNRVREAYDFAYKAHDGQLRKNGDPYITHPLYVAWLVALIKLDETSVIASLLHDALEDTAVTAEELQKKYGDDIVFLVDGLTKINTVAYNVRADAPEFESIRKLLISSTKDVRIILIKLADRLHNTITVSALTQPRRREFALETLRFYAPLADFVGVNFFRKYLEDFAFRDLEPVISEEIVEYLRKHEVKIDDKLVTYDEFITIYSNRFSALLKEHNIQVDVYGRRKGVYSIYKKILRYKGEYDGRHIQAVNDLVGISIVTSSILDCYKALGLVHATYDYVQAYFDDYIARPKSNGYRSIHTSLITERNVKIALQIKTKRMAMYNEYGPASHIYYKEKEKGLPGAGAFLRSLMRWREEAQHAEFYKVDVFKDKIFVFTPQGDVKELPVGATPVDFAYNVHSAIGNACRGALVNGAMKPLDSQLLTGDVIEILTDKKRDKPSADWLRFVKTSEAKSFIKRALKELPAKVETEVAFDTVVIEKEIEKPLISEKEKRSIISEKMSEAHIVRIKGLDNIDTEIAKCCSPIPGDAIIGHVTKSRGIRIHRKECKELAKMEYKVLLEAEWLEAQNDFTVGLSIQGSSADHLRIVHDVSGVLSSMQIKVEKMDTWSTASFNAKLAVTVSSKARLDVLIKKLQRVQGISSVQRATVHA